MGLFDFLNKAKSSMTKQFNPAYSQNKDFLEACCAASASVAAADGTIDDSERDTVITLLTNHAVLGKLYSVNDIKSCAETMFSKATSNSGKLQLVREIEDVKGKGRQMSEDVYMIALDVAAADGTVSTEEEAVLQRLATRLGVDVNITL